MSATPFLDDVIKRYAADVVESAQRNIGAFRTIRGKKRRRVATGDLQKSLTYFIAQNGWKYVVEFTTEASTAQYADVIEKGRRPGSKPPPSSAILKWMNQKNIRLQKKGGGFIKETPALRRNAAFMIARSIGKKGIEGIHYYRDAVESEGEKYAEAFRVALNKEVEVRISLT